MHDVAHPFDERFCSHLVDVLFEAGIIIKRAADDGSSNRHRWIRAEPANEGCFQLEIVFRGISLEELGDFRLCLPPGEVLGGFAVL